MTIKPLNLSILQKKLAFVGQLLTAVLSPDRLTTAVTSFFVTGHEASPGGRDGEKTTKANPLGFAFILALHKQISYRRVYHQLSVSAVLWW
jgi:hypothetical protein